jgi:hypothetical protein
MGDLSAQALQQRSAFGESSHRIFRTVKRLFSSCGERFIARVAHVGAR